MAQGRGRSTIGFVLGGGGHLGASEVGMLWALLDAGITPDLIVGTSVGALNGAAVAARPDLATLEALDTTWRDLASDPVFGGSVLASVARLARTRTALHSNAGIRRLIRRMLPVSRFEELAIPFQCVAASVERAAEHWFSAGELEPAILASTAVPGLLPPVEIDGEHFIDGGLVNSIPLHRAVALGATEVFVLHVGRIEQPLAAPRNVLEVAVVAFEIARRHRFAGDLADAPADVTVHVLPTGLSATGRRARTVERPRRAGRGDTAARIDAARRATSEYLRTHR